MSSGAEAPPLLDYLVKPLRKRTPTELVQNGAGTAILEGLPSTLSRLEPQECLNWAAEPLG